VSIKDKLISNATYLFLNWGFNTFFFVLYWIIIGKTFSPAYYGMIAVAIQIATVLSIVSVVGLGRAMTKLIPELVEKKQKNKIKNIISFSFKTTLVSSLTISIFLIVFSTHLSNLIKLNLDVVWLVAISTIVMSFASIFGDIHYGFQNMRKFFLTDLYGWISMVILTFIFINLGLDYYGPILAIVISFLIIFLTRVETQMFKISKKIIIDKKTIFEYAFPAFVVSLFSLVFNNSQFIILSSMKTLEITGIFGVAMKIASVISVIPTIFSNALFPIISRLSVDKKSKSTQSYLVSLVFRYSFFIVLPVAVFMIFFSKYIVLLFSTVEYLGAATFLPILVLGGIFLGFGYQLLSSLYAIGKPKEFMYSYSISTLVYLISAITLTYYFSAEGMSFSYLISAFSLLAITFILIKKHLTIKIPIKPFLKTLIGAVILFLFLILVKPLTPNTWIAGIIVIIGGLIYLTTLLKLNFYIEEDIKILDFIIDKTPIFKKQIIMFRDYLSKFVKTNYKSK